LLGQKLEPGLHVYHGPNCNPIYHYAVRFTGASPVVHQIFTYDPWPISWSGSEATSLAAPCGRIGQLTIGSGQTQLVCKKDPLLFSNLTRDPGKDHARNVGPPEQHQIWSEGMRGAREAAERGRVSYGPPWAHYLGGYQDRLLGGPLGLPDLCRTVPVGVRRKDHGGEVLG
jgi:hypothetical protein